MPQSALQLAKAKARAKIEARKKKRSEALLRGSTGSGKKKPTPKKKKAQQPTHESESPRKKQKQQKTWPTEQTEQQNFVATAADYNASLQLTPRVFKSGQFGWGFQGHSVTKAYGGESYPLSMSASAVVASGPRDPQWFMENATDVTINVVAKPKVFKSGSVGWHCISQLDTSVAGTKLRIKLTLNAELGARGAVVEQQPTRTAAAAVAEPTKEDGWGIEDEPADAKQEEWPTQAQPEDAKEDGWGIQAEPVPKRQSKAAFQNAPVAATSGAAFGIRQRPVAIDTTEDERSPVSNGTSAATFADSSGAAPEEVKAEPRASWCWEIFQSLFMMLVVLAVLVLLLPGQPLLPSFQKAYLKPLQQIFNSVLHTVRSFLGQ